MKTCDYCGTEETEDENEDEFSSVTAGDECVDLCGSCADHYLR